MDLHVLAYNLKRMMTIIGPKQLMKEMMAYGQSFYKYLIKWHSDKFSSGMLFQRYKERS